MQPPRLRAIGGISCEAVEPVPITATRRPASGTVASQRAECRRGPLKLSRPGMSGQRSWFSGPVLQTKKRARSVSPRSVRSVQWPLASSKVASVSRVSRRMCGQQAVLLGQRCM
jgi:hypothetical protein